MRYRNKFSSEVGASAVNSAVIGMSCCRMS